MGFFDFFNKNKPKRLDAPKILKYDGNSSKIEFKPDVDWNNKTSKEKQDSIKIYTLNDETFINMEIPNEEEEKIVEFNLIRYDSTRHDVVVENYGKKIKEFIIRTLDQQTEPIKDKTHESKVVDTWTALDALLRAKSVNGVLSSEGRAVLRNINGENLNLDRTVYLDRDANGYLQNSHIKDDLKLIKKVLSIDEEENSVDSTTEIKVPVKKLDEKKYGEVDLADFVRGYIVLCRIGNTIGIGDRVIPWEYGKVDEAYRVLAKTELGKEAKDENNPKDRDIMRRKLNQEIIDKSLFLENMIERYVYKTTEEMPDTREIENSQYKEDVLKQTKANREEIKLVTSMMEYSKKALTRKVIREEDQIKDMCDKLEVSDLARLATVRELEGSTQIVSKEQQEKLSNVATSVLTDKIKEMDVSEIIKLIATHNTDEEDKKMPVEDTFIVKTAQDVLKDKLTRNEKRQDEEQK